MTLFSDPAETLVHQSHILAAAYSDQSMWRLPFFEAFTAVRTVSEYSKSEYTAPLR